MSASIFVLFYCTRAYLRIYFNKNISKRERKISQLGTLERILRDKGPEVKTNRLTITTDKYLRKKIYKSSCRPIVTEGFERIVCFSLYKKE